MFAALLRNIAVTGVAYAVISGIGLVLAPFLIANYGLAGYGQILLARVFLPNAVFGMLDLGLGETTTRTVASARATGEWADSSSVLSLLVVLALALATLVGAALVATASYLPGWFALPPRERAGFADIMVLTGLLQPVLFLSLVGEGVLKGMERFRLLRSIEILGALAFGALAVGAGQMGLTANWVAAALLASLVLRFLAVAAAAVVLLRQHGVTISRWSSSERADVFHWSRLMLGSKLIGGVQNQIASPLIGLLLTPAAVGIYDAAVRLPRFAKVAFGLVSNTVLPLASRLQASSEVAQLSRLATYGLLGAVAATAPIAMACAVYSQAILQVWIGASVSGNWGWQSAMFFVTMLMVPISFGGAIGLASREATTGMIKITAFQTVIQLSLALAFIGILEQWAFVVAQAVAAGVTFVPQFMLLRRHLGLADGLAWRLGAIVFASLVIALAIRLLGEPGSLLELALVLAAIVTLVYASMFLFLLRADERVALLQLGRRQPRQQ